MPASSLTIKAIPVGRMKGGWAVRGTLQLVPSCRPCSTVCETFLSVFASPYVGVYVSGVRVFLDHSMAALSAHHEQKALVFPSSYMCWVSKLQGPAISPFH